MTILSDLQAIFSPHYAAGEISLTNMRDGKLLANSTCWFGQPTDDDFVISITVERRSEIAARKLKREQAIG